MYKTTFISFKIKRNIFIIKELILLRWRNTLIIFMCYQKRIRPIVFLAMKASISHSRCGSFERKVTATPLSNHL